MKKNTLLLCLLFQILLAGCSHTLQTEYKTTQYKITASDTLKETNRITEFLQPYHDSLQLQMQEVVSYTDNPLIKGNPESNLGNFVADACQWLADSLARTGQITNTDFTMLNSGGLRTALPKGNITRGNIFELMPFENELVIVYLPSDISDKLFSYIAKRNGNPVSGIKMQIKENEAINIEIQGKKISSNPECKLLTSDYLANGGDNLDFLVNLKRDKTGVKVRDAIFLYLRHLQLSGSKITTMTDGRIYR